MPVLFNHDIPSPHLPVVRRPSSSTGAAAATATAAVVAPRQATATGDFVAIPAGYSALHSSPAPGVIAGIVLGSVAGFLLLLYLVYFALNFSPAIESSAVGPASSYASRSAVSYRSRSRAADRKPGRKRASRTAETYEVRTRSRVAPVVVDPPRPNVVNAGPPRRGEPEFDEDEIVVMEENSPAPKKNRRRDSRRRSEERWRRESYREGDSDRYDRDLRKSRHYSRER